MSLGPVVRIAPNILSFSSASAAHTIYDTPETFRKGSFYDGYTPSPSNPVRSIVSVRNPSVHSIYRAYFSSCFSPTAVQQQGEHIRTHLRDFCELVRKSTNREQEGVEVGVLLDCLAFDLAGTLAFGSGFRCIRDGKLHFWPAAVKKWYRVVALTDVRNRFPLAMAPAMAVLKLLTGDTRKKTREYAAEVFIKYDIFRLFIYSSV